MLCNSVLESFSAQVFGECDTEPDERLVTSESRAAEVGLVVITSPFRSMAELAMGGTAVVSKELSGTFGKV